MQEGGREHRPREQGELVRPWLGPGRRRETDLLGRQGNKARLGENGASKRIFISFLGHGLAASRLAIPLPLLLMSLYIK